MTTAPSDLMAAAVAAYGKAYAPYSRFQVGAAVRDEHGQIYAGCNVENAAYPIGNCAEASALAAMVMAGGRRIVEAAVVGAGAGLVTPCGGCRQRLREFGRPDLPVHICDEHGTLRRTFTLDELLPASFGPEHLVTKTGDSIVGATGKSPSHS
jgi:cytidine deaminase